MGIEESKPSEGDHADESTTSPRCAHDGLKVKEIFAAADEHPFDQLSWEKRTARIIDDKGEVIFEQQDAEVPAEWSQLATNVVVSKYFYGETARISVNTPFAN